MTGSMLHPGVSMKAFQKRLEFASVLSKDDQTSPTFVGIIQSIENDN